MADTMADVIAGMEAKQAEIPPNAGYDKEVLRNAYRGASPERQKELLKHYSTNGKTFSREDQVRMYNDLVRAQERRYDDPDEAAENFNQDMVDLGWKDVGAQDKPEVTWRPEEKLPLSIKEEKELDFNKPIPHDPDKPWEMGRYEIKTVQKPDEYVTDKTLDQITKESHARADAQLKALPQATPTKEKPLPLPGDSPTGKVYHSPEELGLPRDKPQPKKQVPGHSRHKYGYRDI